MTNAELEKVIGIIRESSQKCANTFCHDCKYNQFTGVLQNREETCIENRIIDAVKENFKEVENETND